MKTKRSLAQTLRIAAISEDAIELCAEVSAKLIRHYWKDSGIVNIRPHNEREPMGFTICVDGRETMTFIPSFIDNDGLTPAVCLHTPPPVTPKTDVLGKFDDADEALAFIAGLLTPIIEKEKATTTESHG